MCRCASLVHQIFRLTKKTHYSAPFGGLIRKGVPESEKVTLGSNEDPQQRHSNPRNIFSFHRDDVMRRASPASRVKLAACDWSLARGVAADFTRLLARVMADSPRFVVLLIGIFGSASRGFRNFGTMHRVHLARMLDCARDKRQCREVSSDYSCRNRVR